MWTDREKRVMKTRFWVVAVVTITLIMLATCSIFPSEAQGTDPGPAPSCTGYVPANTRTYRLQNDIWSPAGSTEGSVRVLAGTAEFKGIWTCITVDARWVDANDVIPEAASAPASAPITDGDRSGWVPAQAALDANVATVDRALDTVDRVVVAEAAPEIADAIGSAICLPGVIGIIGLIVVVLGVAAVKGKI